MNIRAAAGRISVWAGLLLLIAACSDPEPDVQVGGVESTVQSTTTISSTSTTVEEQTTTTTSDLAVARAELEEVIEAWYTSPIDTSKGDAGLPSPHYTTGLLHQRERELPERSEAAGEIFRSDGGHIEILDVRVDLEAGTAETDVCTADTAEVIDAATGDVLIKDNGKFYRGLIYAEFVDDGWKLSEFSPSLATDDPQPCDLDDVES